MFRKEALPFISGIFTGVGLAAIIWLGVQINVPQFDINDYSRSQHVQATGFMLDGHTATVGLTIRTKTDLHEKWREPEVKEYIRNVMSRHSSENWLSMVEVYKTESTKYLGLDCNSMLMNVSVEGLPEEAQ